MQEIETIFQRSKGDRFFLSVEISKAIIQFVVRGWPQKIDASVEISANQTKNVSSVNYVVWAFLISLNIRHSKNAKN